MPHTGSTASLPAAAGGADRFNCKLRCFGSIASHSTGRGYGCRVNYMQRLAASLRRARTTRSPKARGQTDQFCFFCGGGGGGGACGLDINVITGLTNGFTGVKKYDGMAIVWIV
jgi:hypothetical protein